MQASEPFLPFSHNLLYKPLRFDDKLDFIRKIIPIDEKTRFLVDANHNFHLKAENEESASLQFPLPPYAHNTNPRVLYSVDYLDLYRYLYKKKTPSGFDEREEKYIQLSYLGDYKLAVQLDKRDPVVILDLHKPQNSPLVLEDVFGAECLISVCNGCIAWYERNTNLVILYHYILRKRKILNFTKLVIERLHCLKDHVIVAIADYSLEVLDYSRNKVIKSVCFVNGCYHVRPDYAIHEEGNIISYIDEGYIHVCKTKKGKIEWENHYDFGDYDEESDYVFITHNLIALESFDEVDILLLDSQNFSLHTKIQHPRLGFSDTQSLGARCCEASSGRSYVESIHYLGGNSFGIIEILCGPYRYFHGQQRLTQFSLKNLKTEDVVNQQPGVDSITFELSKSILFEEFRDPVRVIDILDENLAMLITEKTRVFRVNLKENSVKYIAELSGLVKQKKRDDEVRNIDKFFALSENKVAVSTKINSSYSVRIVIISLEMRRAEWNSAHYEEDDDTDEEDEFCFFDMIKVEPSRILVSYREIENNRVSYKIGKLRPSNDQEDFGKFGFYEYDMQQRNDEVFDRLWNFEGSSLVAMRHGEKNLSFLDLTTKRIEKEFFAGKYLPMNEIGGNGICDVKLIQKDVICISVRTTFYPALAILIYNVQTEELLTQVKANQDIIGIIRQCYWEQGIMRTMERMVIFGSDNSFGNRLDVKPLQEMIRQKRDSLDISYNFGFQPSISSRNFKPLLGKGDQFLICENFHHRNFVCILKSPNFKIECIRILKKAVGNAYHKYLYKDVVDMIFGVR